MRSKLVALAATALALSAPGAFAAAPPLTLDCGFLTTSESTLTGNLDTYTGISYGYIVGDLSETSVSVACSVRVNGATVASTAIGTGTTSAVTAGQVTYIASDADDVDLCAEWTTSTDSGTSCGDATMTSVPPPAVVDMVGLAVDLVNDLHPAVRCISAVNLGTCNRGICVVNTGTCDGGTCVVNTGYCGSECISGVNIGGCGQRIHQQLR